MVIGTAHIRAAAMRRDPTAVGVQFGARAYMSTDRASHNATARTLHDPERRGARRTAVEPAVLWASILRPVRLQGCRLNGSPLENGRKHR